MHGANMGSDVFQSQAGHIAQYLKSREDKYYCQRLDPSWKGEHLVKGREPGRDAIILSSNDYLSLSNHPQIVEAQVAELRKHGRGVVMSDVFRTGSNPLAEFERGMAELMGTEDSVLCQSGWCANVGLIQAIAEEGTPVYVDLFAHMSLWEGIRSAGARAIPFRHNSAESLERLVERHGPGYILVDAVYSTSGEIAPLAKLCDVAERGGCALIVDESHSLGVMGLRGEGLVASLGLRDRVLFRTASLSKAFCARGGIVAGPQRTLKYFRYEARPAIFSSAVLTHEGVALCATLDVIQASQPARLKLRENSSALRDGLDALGYPVRPSQTQIIALQSGDEWRTRILRDALESRGVFGAVFCAPATPRNKSLVRLSVHSAMATEALARVLEVCAEIRGEVQLSDWPSARRKPTAPAQELAVAA